MRPSERARAALAWVGRSGRGSAALALLLCALGLALRLKLAAYEPEYPSIDENEVVEQAVAFMGGELRQHFVKYGPLTMYLLAGIYHAIAAARGLSALEYASRVFFRGGEHYFVARALAGSALSILALTTFFVLRKRLGALPALIGCALLALPVVDVLVVGVRIDMLQAAFQGLALLALGEAAAGDGRRAWVAAGSAAGFGIASKPLPGLLILPCFALASWLAARPAPSGEPRGAAARLAAALRRPNAWLAALACCGCALLGDPAILDLRGFVAAQQAAVALHSGAMAAGPSVLLSLSQLGLPFGAALLASLVAVAARREPRALVAAAFLVLYVAAFWGRSRHYFLVAAAVAACLLVAHGAAAAQHALTSRGRRASTWLPLASVAAVLALAAPALGRQKERSSRPNPSAEATRWVHANIPSGTRLYYVGWRGAGPRLVAENTATQATFGDHFGYERQRYVFLRQAFERGYADYVRSGEPRYAIASYHNKPQPRASKKTPRAITDSLLKTARAERRRYIIVTGYDGPHVGDLGYTWLRDAVLEQEIGKTAILRVPP